MPKYQGKTYPIKKLIETFDLKVANPKFADVERHTISPSIHRAGLELAGAYAIVNTKANIIGWGTKEAKWLKTLSAAKSKAAIDAVLTEETPLILLSKGMPVEIRKHICVAANKKRIPVVTTKQHIATLRATIGAELVEYFAEEESVHGSLVVVNGIGVMIIGESGVGKSEAVIELIQRNHLFVTDDTVVIKQFGKGFIGTYSALTKGLLEARGIGLIDIPHIYGARSFKESVAIELVVELVPGDKIKDVDRLGNHGLEYKVLKGEIPLMKIPVNQGRSISSLVEAAVNVFVARKDGLDPLKMIAERREK